MGPNDIAVAWVQALTGRGVTLQVRGKRLVLHPKSAFGAMSTEERATLKQFKAVIIAVLTERYSGCAGPSVQVAALTPSEGIAPTSVSAPKPERCAQCGRAPCIGQGHEHFTTLHPGVPVHPQYDLAQLARDGVTVREAGFTYGLTEADDPTDVMLESLRRQRRRY
jgi:hypothetical protein